MSVQDMVGQCMRKCLHLCFLKIVRQAEALAHVLGRFAPYHVCNAFAAQLQQARHVQIVCRHHQMVELIRVHLPQTGTVMLSGEVTSQVQTLLRRVSCKLCRGDKSAECKGIVL